jgi:hypothetical protein
MAGCGVISYGSVIILLMILKLLIRILCFSIKPRLGFGRFSYKRVFPSQLCPLKRFKLLLHPIQLLEQIQLKAPGFRYPGQRKKRTDPRALFPLAQSSLRQLINIVQHDASSYCYAVHRVFSHKDRHFKLFGQQHVDAMEKGSASCEDDTAVDDIG